jgi:protein SCO1/2
MKKLFLVFALLAVETLASHAAEPAAAPHATPAADPAIPSGSLYALESKWIDQAGKPVAWAAGTPRVIALGYATCKGICPRIIADMQRIEKGLTDPSKVRFTFVTLDPQNDREAQMQALAANHKLDPARWQLLIGDNDGLMDLAVVLGVRFNRLPNGVDFVHSYLIVVVGADGKVLHKWTDPKQGPEEAIKVLNSL